MKFMVIFIYIIYIYSYVKVKQKSTKQKKAYVHVHPVPKTMKKSPNSWPLPDWNLSPPPLFTCFACRVVTKHTGGKHCCVTASESSNPLKMSCCCFAGWRHWCWARGAGAIRAHAVDRSRFKACRNTPQFNLFVPFSHRMDFAEFLAACMYAHFSCNTSSM